MNDDLRLAQSQALNALTLIDRHAGNTPDHAAVLFEGQRLTYGELVERSVAVALALGEHGIGQGSRVCMLAHNCPDYYAVYLGILRAGGTLFPINADLSQSEVAYIVEKTDLALVIHGSDCSEAVETIWQQHGLSAASVSLDTLLETGLHSQREAVDGSQAWPQRAPDSVAVVIHTSGTTALPKGVVATDHMEVASAQSLIKAWQIKPEDISVCALPLSYTFGLFTASFVALSAGATVLLFKKFNPVRVLEGIQEFGASYMVGVPAMYAMMLEHTEQTGKSYNLERVRFMASSGAPIAAIVKKEFNRRLNVPLLEYYALSECTPIFSFDFNEPMPPIGSSGRLVDGAQVKILDDEGKPVARGDTGRLLVRSERLMHSYYLDPERNALAFAEDWFITGDLAYCDAQGFYHVVGRERDQVISGGHKIASAEVEGCILLHDAVARAAVVGSPDKILGEIVKAVLVLKEGCSLDPEQVIAHCEEHLARHKVPRIVEFRDSLPTSPAGKVLKRQLV